MASSSASMIHAAGRQEADEVRRQGREVGGKQATGYAKAGVRLDRGSPVQVMANTAARAELAAMRTEFAYDMRAWEVQATANRGAAGVVSSALMSSASLLMGYGGGGGGSGPYSRGASASSGLPYYGGGQSTTPPRFQMPNMLRNQPPSYFRTGL